jgi:hypothetical protein
MSGRTRIAAYGSAAALVAAAGACVLLFDGLAAQVLAILLSMAGAGGALLFAFYDVGVGEERDRAEERERRRPERTDPPRRPTIPRWPRRPS